MDPARRVRSFEVPVPRCSAARIALFALVWGWGTIPLSACSDAGEVRDAGDDDSGRTSERDAAASERDAGTPPTCVAPRGVPTSPHSIADVVTLLNALPKPVTLPCFLDTLARPLAINATRSVLSAQPAQGKRSPRIFLFFDGLTLSVVPAGDGSRLLEFGELRGEAQSLKAELKFPIQTELDAASPYERVRFDDSLSTCGFCHQGEARAPEIPSLHAYVSITFQPLARERVSVEELYIEQQLCDALAEPDRCAMLDALFRVRMPVAHEFPATWKTFL